MNIQAKIKSRGFTIAQVAARMKKKSGGVGISQGTLSTILNGNPTVEKLQEIADIIGMTLPELVSDGEYPGFLAVVRKGGQTHTFEDEESLRRFIGENRD